MKSLRERAMDLLARREHSLHELHRKLISKGFSADELREVLHELMKEGLQSDARFAEAYVRQRMMAGFGPRRIEMELQHRGVGEDLIQHYVWHIEQPWWDRLKAVWWKKFSGVTAVDAKAYGKQQRFLLQRGFEPEQVRRFLKGT